jgi:hypothetical protein
MGNAEAVDRVSSHSGAPDQTIGQSCALASADIFAIGLTIADTETGRIGRSGDGTPHRKRLKRRSLDAMKGAPISFHDIKAGFVTRLVQIWNIRPAANHLKRENPNPR